MPICRLYLRLYQSCLKSQDFVKSPQGSCGVYSIGDHQPPFEALDDRGALRGRKRRLDLGGGKGMLFKTIRSQMIIASLRCMPLKLDRRIENDPPSFCSCCRPIREKMRGIPYGRSCTEVPAFPFLADRKPAEEAPRLRVRHRQAGWRVRR